MADLAASLKEDRRPGLGLGLELLEQAWHSFDTARPRQPPVSQETHDFTEVGLPEDGVGLERALDGVAQVLDESLSQARPRYFGYIGSSGLESAVLADALAASHDCNLAAESAAANLVEQQTLRWVAEFVGFPATSGTFASGGMVSNLSALMAARTARLPESRECGLRVGSRPAVVYTSADAHASVCRAVEILGIGRANLRLIPVTDRRRMDVRELRRRIAADLAAGSIPMAVVATAGTTLTGAVDPLREIAEVCAEHGIWMHVDGAYGLPAAASTRAGGLFDGLALADSATVDAHKWMFVPKACSVLLMRPRQALRAAFAHDTSYMVTDEQAKSGPGYPVDETLEYSRPFRSLKLWMALRAHGAAAFRSAIDRNLRQARELYAAVDVHPRFEPMLTEPDLSVVPLRRIPASGDPDLHNSRLARAMQADGRVYVTGAEVDGKSCLRPCIVNFRTTDADVAAIVDLADEIGARLESP
ncbi:MAG: pyridoxal phosphate-dependent decarboxylase family protein [Nocardioides sp.]